VVSVTKDLADLVG